MNAKAYNLLIKTSLVLTSALFFGCATGPYQDEFAYKRDPVMSLNGAAREGWATDPHLSYNLYSYYPMNFYNTGLYGQMGYYGVTYY